MEIRQLKYFLKVAETLNFSEASRKLYITQSTLSQQISHLEQEIGLPLFERNSHEVYLTEAGKELRPYAQNAVNSAEACVDHMNDLKEMLTGELNIGVTFSFSNIMAETLIAFLHAYPHVKLNIQYRTMQELMDGLKKRELDLVLAFKPLKNEKAVDSRAIFSNRLAAIVNVNHPLARLSSAKTDRDRYFAFGRLIFYSKNRKITKVYKFFKRLRRYCFARWRCVFTVDSAICNFSVISRMSMCSR